MGSLGKLLIHPVDFDCNLSCGYCYNGSHCQTVPSPIRTISSDLLFRIFDEIACELSGSVLTVIWHGGEPLLAGKEFFRTVPEIQRIASRGRYRIKNCLQTNGVLIDSEWVEIFQEYGYAPSVSIDGPARFHDLVRRYPDGTGTYEHALRGYNLLRGAGLRTGLLTVVSQANVLDPLAMWEWILELGIKSMDVLPCLEPERVRSGHGLWSVSESEIADFNIRLFDLWFENGDPTIRIRTFRDAVKGMLGGHVRVCSWKGGCLNHISVDPTGAVFPCGRYHCFPETSFGSFSDHPLSGIMVSETTIRIQSEIANAQERCAQCRWNSICHSGCPFLKYALHGTWDAPYVHCESRRKLFAHVHSRLEHPSR